MRVRTSFGGRSGRRRRSAHAERGAPEQTGEVDGGRRPEGDDPGVRNRQRGLRDDDRVWPGMRSAPGVPPNLRTGGQRVVVSRPDIRRPVEQIRAASNATRTSPLYHAVLASSLMAGRAVAVLMLFAVAAVVTPACGSRGAGRGRAASGPPPAAVAPVAGGLYEGYSPI